MHSTRSLAILALALLTAWPAAAYIEHIRHFSPADSSMSSIQKLAFVLGKSVGNPSGPTRFYIRDVSVSMNVDPNSDLPTPGLLEQGALTLNFVANDIAWSISPDSCKQDDRLVKPDWLFCSVGGSDRGFALEPRMTGNAPVIALHFGRVWKDSGDQLPAPVTNGETATLFMSESLDESVVNQLIVADGERDLVTVEFRDMPTEAM